jgi:hypothetical protein
MQLQFHRTVRKAGEFLKSRVLGMQACSSIPRPVGITATSTALNRRANTAEGLCVTRRCITCDALVRYAYRMVLEPENLTFCDRLILHALGVSWEKNPCPGGCRQFEES